VDNRQVVGSIGDAGRFESSDNRPTNGANRPIRIDRQSTDRPLESTDSCTEGIDAQSSGNRQAIRANRPIIARFGRESSDSLEILGAEIYR
jgi:hypothetical protein